MTSEDGTELLFRRAGAGLPRADLRKFCLRLSAELAGGRPFVCLLSDDRELRRLNATFLGRDYPADVLSFPSGQDSGPLGEIAVSTERAARQAREFGHSTADEIRILILHGLLHLLGMDHERDRGRMARAERAWRAKLGLKSTLTGRARARRLDTPAKP